MFGEPGKGTHKYRIFDISIWDVFLTILGGYFISIYMKVELWKILLVLFILGIVMHRLFCVKTTIDKLIFGE